MTVSFAIDEFGRIVCSLANGKEAATVTSSSASEAASDLLTAMDRLEAEGYGDCYWHEAIGEYRWAFRASGDSVHVAAIWSTGVVTGWEHVFFADCPLGLLLHQVRSGLRSLPVPTP
jgi:hypothetical protein